MDNSDLIYTLQAAYAASGALLKGAHIHDIPGDQVEALETVCKALAEPQQDTLLALTRHPNAEVQKRAKHILRSFSEELAREQGRQFSRPGTKKRRLAGMFFKL